MHRKLKFMPLLVFKHHLEIPNPLYLFDFNFMPLLVLLLSVSTYGEGMERSKHFSNHVIKMAYE
jgi:hypothetical protein